MMRFRTTAAAVLAALLLAATAHAEVIQKGNLRVATTGTITPRRLPRSGAAPIAVSVGGKISTVDGSLPPQLRSMKIELNRHGLLDTAGLPDCKVSQIQPASSARALAACRAALVGQGTFTADIVLGTQQPYPTKGRLLVFNGTYDGRPALLGQIYAAHPFATSFVFPFTISSLAHGTYGTVLSAALPGAFTAWGYLTGVAMRLGRNYVHEGTRHSLLSAGCPAPEGFPGATFPFARVNFGFQHRTLKSVLIGNCKVKQ